MIKTSPEKQKVFETNPLQEQPVIEVPKKQKVFETNPVRTEWTDVDWAVFISKGIMHCADGVSEEDLYLLHDVMIRCQERQRDME